MNTKDRGAANMLVLSRKVGDKIVIGDNITVEVVRIKGNRITLGLVAPANVTIMRSELNNKPAVAKNVTTELVVEDGLLVAG